MFEALSTALKSVINPYADEARSLAGHYHSHAVTYADAIVTRLDGITMAIRNGQLEAPIEKEEFSFADADSTKEIAVVPQGTVWVLEVFQGYMVSGSATIIIEANGRFRFATSVATNGLSTVGVAMARNMQFRAGDAITARTTGMSAGEDMRCYMQFRAKPINEPRSRTGGQPEQAADRNNVNGQAEVLERHSTPGIFLGHNIRGGTAPRNPHLPPSLPRVR